MTWERLDKQMADWAPRLISEVKVSSEDCQKLATKTASEVCFLPREVKDEIAGNSPVSVHERLAELRAFQGWMDTAQNSKNSPYVTRAQVLTQNYICFVYLPESCFRVLAKRSPPASVARYCANFLSDGRIRSFRNAIAHANWTYRQDFNAITFWAKKGTSVSDPIVQFEVEQRELNFWQALSRCVAYATLSNLG